MKKITVCGKQYPCYVTMGAMRRYKIETGEDVSAMGNDVANMATFLYCCVKSACNAEGVEFDMDIDRFCDCITPEQMNEFAQAMTDGAEKKTKAKK